MRTRRGTPLFHALVVAGAGLSAGSCGGKSTGQTGALDGDAAAGGEGGSGGESGSGGRSGAGGRVASSGGAPSAGGTGAGGAVVLPPPVVPPQWECELNYCEYGGGEHFVWGEYLEAPCPVNPARPRSPADCAPDEWFDCHPAFLRGGTELVWINCACTPMTDAGCDSCPETNGDEATCEGQRRYCGCARTVILL